MFVLRKFLLWTFLFTSTLLEKSVFSDKNEKSSPRIVSGKPAEYHPYAKYVVSIRTNREVDFFGENHLCTGTIVSSRKILTSALCIVNNVFLMEPNDFVVIAGSPQRLEWTPTTRMYNVSNLIIHPNYSNKSLRANLAILVLDQDIEESPYIKIIPIGRTSPEEDSKCLILGWGRIFHRGPSPDGILMTEINIWGKKYCVKKFQQMSNCMICAGDYIDYFRFGCEGDSGSPLICSGVLYGLISFGVGCGLTSRAFDFFTDTSCFKDWIKGSTKNSNPSNINLLLGLSIILIRRN